MVSPQVILKAMFAAVGALGVSMAMAAFAVFMARRYALLWSVIYATSFGIWYFSSIEESKIVTATLCAAYIAVYLRIRETWSGRGAALLTAILLLACLNEIASGLLIVIPALDALIGRGWATREVRWIALHGLAGPVALIILEFFVNGWLVPEGKTAEGASHLSMLLFYVAKNDYSAATLYAFCLNWLFFNIAAPLPHAELWVPERTNLSSYFEPALANYFSSPASAALVAVFAVLIVVGVWRRSPGGHAAGRRAILASLAGYTLLRAAFFFIFNPSEPLLFTPAVSLAHMLLVAVPFAASRFAAKGTLLVIAATLLLVVNGAFIIGR